jgi:hypothetical protein
VVRDGGASRGDYLLLGNLRNAASDDRSRHRPGIRLVDHPRPHGRNTRGPQVRISEMAAAEKIERGYLGALLRLQLLASGLVKAILQGDRRRGRRCPR